MRKSLFTRSNRLPRVVASVAGLLMIAAGASAAPASVDMTWTTPTVTPRGYAEYCARYEGQCLATAAEQASYAAIAKAGASDNLWAATFAPDDDASTANIQTAAAAPAGNIWSTAFNIEPASLTEPVGAAKDQVDWASGFAALEAKRRTNDAPAAPIVMTADASDHPVATHIVLDKRTWKLLSKTNLAINNAIKRADDLDNDGVPDQWNLPLLDGTRKGDCEDYALEKRRQLVKAGLPPEALSLAIVRTSWGETHAVLVVDTDHGTYVLDSLTPWVTPWTQAHFQWITRQAAGGGLWVRPPPAGFQTASLDR